MTRAELLNRISSHELTEWMVYGQIEPFGQETQYFGPAITSSILANVNRKKGTKPAKVDDFMPKFEQVKQTAGEQLQFAAMMTSAMGGQDLRKPTEDNEDE